MQANKFELVKKDFWPTCEYNAGYSALMEVHRPATAYTNRLRVSITLTGCGNDVKSLSIMAVFPSKDERVVGPTSGENGVTGSCYVRSWRVRREVSDKR